MLNLIDFLVLVHVFVTVRVLRSQTRALICSNFQRSWVSPRHFSEIHGFWSVSRGSLRSYLSFWCLPATLWMWMFRRHTWCCQMSDFAESHSVRKSFTCSRVCVGPNVDCSSHVFCHGLHGTVPTDALLTWATKSASPEWSAGAVCVAHDCAQPLSV